MQEVSSTNYTCSSHLQRMLINLSCIFYILHCFILCLVSPLESTTELMIGIIRDFSRELYTVIFSSLSCRSTGLWSLLSKFISLSNGCFSVSTFCGAILLAVLWLLFLAAGTSWLCFPSYVVMTALGSVEALSTCLRTLHPTLVHL